MGSSPSDTQKESNMKTYNHLFSLAFTVSGSTHPDAEDVTPSQFRAAVIKRLDQIGADKDEWFEAVGEPSDSYVEEPPLLDFTVIGFREESGQIWCGHVKAHCKSSAFAAAAREEETLTFVACMQGLHHEADTLGFPGEGVVDADTVLNQPDVFGRSDDANQDEGEG